MNSSLTKRQKGIIFPRYTPSELIIKPLTIWEKGLNEGCFHQLWSALLVVTNHSGRFSGLQILD